MARPGLLPPTVADRPFAVREALAAGVTPDRLRSGDLTAPFHGTRLPAREVDALARLRALATRFRPGDAFTGPTAAWLWGMPLPRAWQAGPLDVSSTPGVAPMRRQGVVGSRRGATAEAEIRRGIPVVSPFETWLSLARIVDLDDLVAVGDFMTTPHEGAAPLITLDGLRTRLQESPRRVGLVAARSAAPWIRIGSRSRPETHLRLAIVRAGMPEPRLNEPLAGSSRCPDLSWPEFRVAVEYNGRHHEDRAQIERDLRRAEEIEMLGWTTVNVDRVDLYRHRPTTLARVSARLRSRGWRP